MAGRTLVPVTPSPAPAALTSMRAGARVIDATARAARDNEAGSLSPETPEEREAWIYFDKLPEVTEITNGVAGLLSQVRFYIGYNDSEGNERPCRDPRTGAVADGFTEEAVAAAEDVMRRYSDGSGSQRGIMFSQGQVWTVCGDGYLVGYWVDDRGKPVPEGDPTAVREEFRFVARGALWKNGNGEGYQLQETRAGAIVTLPPQIMLRRMIFEHPRYPGEGQGWVRSSLEVCRDLLFFTLAERASAKSNLPADVWVVPSEASPKDPNPQGVGPGDEGALGDGTGQAPQSFAAKLEEMLGGFVTEALSEIHSGNAVIPAFLSIEERLVDRFEKLSFRREIDVTLPPLVEQARDRLAESAPAPIEMLKGLSGASRWNGKQVSEEEYRRYFRPTALAMSDAWTASVLHHELRLRSVPPTILERMRVLPDPREVVTPPDKRELANDGVRVGAIGPSGWRKMLGVPDDLAPSPEELELMKELRTNPDSHAKSGNGRGDQGPPDSTRSVKSSGALVASGAVAAPALAVRLLEIEHDVRGRLEEAAEAALDAALVRAGASLRNWVRSARMQSCLPSPLEAIDNRVLPRLLGDRALALATERLGTDDARRREDLFGAALASLLTRFEVLVRQGYAKAQQALGVQVPAEEIDANVERGRETLRAGMMLVADREVFGVGDEPDEEGEQVEGSKVPNTVLRLALAAAGGALVYAALRPRPSNTDWTNSDGTVTLESLVFGPTLAAVSPEASQVMWLYGDEYRSRPYEPHAALDGTVLTGPDDPALEGSPFSAFAGFYAPGDHEGCRCDVVPMFKEG